MEIKMHKWYVPAFVVVAGLAWFASATPLAQAQYGVAGLTQGERVTLYIDQAQTNSPVRCEVVNVTDRFVGCAPDPTVLGRSPTEAWYNLRFVTRIERSVK